MFCRSQCRSFSKMMKVIPAGSNTLRTTVVRFCTPSGSLGRGAGKGGGAGGSVRESGGGLGQYGAAQEELFFYNKQKEQLEKMKQKLKKEETPKKEDK